MKPTTSVPTSVALVPGQPLTSFVIQSTLTLLFLVILSISFEAKAQVPVAFYDFEINTDRNTDVSNNFEITPEMSLSGVNPVSVTKAGGGSISGVTGAGLAAHNGFGKTNATNGRAISSPNWSESNTQPAVSAITQYYQFSVTTTGLKDITLAFDLKRDGDGPDFCGVLYSTDGGTTFTDFTVGNMKNISTAFEQIQVDFTGLAAIDNNSNVIFRIYGFKAKKPIGVLILDNVLVSAKNFTAGTKTLLNESSIYTGVTSGATGAVFNRPIFTVSGTGTEVTLGSDIAISSAMTVTTGTGLNFGTSVNRILGAGTFALQSGATIKINSPQGISTTAGTGNIQLTGAKNFDGAANYIYEPNAAGTLVTGNALPTDIYGNLQLNPGILSTGPIEFTNTSTTLYGTYNLVDGTAAINTSKTLAIGTGGRITFGANTADALTGTGSFTLFAGATIDISSPDGISTLTGKGNIQVTGSRNFYSGANYNYVVNMPGALTTGNALPATISGSLNVTLGPLTNSPLTLSQNTTLTGSLTATAGEIALGSNTLTVNSGLSLNGGSLSIGAGSLVLNGPAISGSTAQTGLFGSTVSNLAINGTASGITLAQSLTALRNLTVNNANGITLNNNLDINGVLTLTSGKLYTTAAKKIKVRSNATLVGGSATSFVDGPMTYENDGTSAVTRVFPIGKGNVYRPVTLTVTQDAAIPTEYTAEQTEGGYAPIAIPEAELTHVSAIRYFSIDKGAGANITNGTVTLTYGADDDVEDPTYLRIAKTNADYSGWINLGRDAATSSSTNTGTITSSINFTSFSKFILGNGVGGSNPLPVELASFTASKKGADVVLDWTTASEKDNKGFEVQVSGNSSEFRNLGFVASKNSNSAMVQTYSFTDKEMGKTGTRYYRLKQTDLDGTVTYSALKAVTFGKGKAEVAVYPNPFEQNLTLEVAGKSDQNATIEITDALGKVVYTQNLQLTGNTNQTSLELPAALTKGVYTLAVTTAEGISYQKLVKN